MKMVKSKNNDMYNRTSHNDFVVSKDPSSAPVAYIVYKDSQYWIYNKPYYNQNDEILENPEDRIWYTIRNYRNSASSNGYKLQEGDILRFGRARIKIVKINTGEEEPKFEKSVPRMSEKLSQINLDSTINEAQNEDGEIMTEKNTCRICFLEAEDANPLISVCK